MKNVRDSEGTLLIAGAWLADPMVDIFHFVPGLFAAQIYQFFQPRHALLPFLCLWDSEPSEERLWLAGFLREQNHSTCLQPLLM